jgi:hypothetical protein
MCSQTAMGRDGIPRIIANRLRLWLADILHPSQHCGIRDIAVFEAVATLRDAVTYAEHTDTPLCLLSIDFAEAFDRLFHDYLHAIIREHDFSAHYQRRIRNLYTNEISSVQINVFRSQPIPIRSAVRQGCTMSMILYAICINPLLHTLDTRLIGLLIGRRHARTSVIAHVYDVRILLTNPSDIPKLQKVLQS